MRKYLLTVSLFIFCSFVSACGRTAPSNEIPMYGNVPFTPEQNEINDKFIQDVVKQYGSREAAAEDSVKFGWHYYNEKHDPKTAMKRFNQAWLLDPNNPGAYFGFAFLMGEEDNHDEAIRFYKKTLELDPNQPIPMCNLGREYYDKAYISYKKFKRKEMKEYLDEAVALYDKASQIATADEDLEYIYYQWACALLLMKDYAGSWEKVKLSRKYGGKSIEPEFIKELSRYMPEPNE